MRRFVNILVAAVALMGCVACNTDNTDVAVDSVSFYAAVDAQQSRLALEQDGQQWNSVWQGGEQLAVTADEQTTSYLQTQLRSQPSSPAQLRA